MPGYTSLFLFAVTHDLLLGLASNDPTFWLIFLTKNWCWQLRVPQNGSFFFPSALFSKKAAYYCDHGLLPRITLIPNAIVFHGPIRNCNPTEFEIDIIFMMENGAERAKESVSIGKYQKKIQDFFFFFTKEGMFLIIELTCLYWKWLAFVWF